MPNRQGYDHIGNFNFKGDKAPETPQADWDKASFPMRGGDDEKPGFTVEIAGHGVVSPGVPNVEPPARGFMLDLEGEVAGHLATAEDDGPSTFLSVAGGDVNRDGSLEFLVDANGDLAIHDGVESESEEFLSESIDFPSY